MRTSLPYTLLRRTLKAHGYNQDDVAALLGRSRQYISDRMNAKGEWLLGEAYTMLEALDINGNDIGLYFPADAYTAVAPPKREKFRVLRRTSP